jgi:hypothetical protein
MSVASVGATGEITTENATGETEVTVADARNNLHFDTMMASICCFSIELFFTC